MKEFWRRVAGMPLRGPDRRAMAQLDPWGRLPWSPPLSAFGPGAREEFDTYFLGALRHVIRDPGGVADWLSGCRYAADEHLLDERDHWLHPVTFELVRAGDCEDFALWAWRQLVDASYDASFVVGMASRADGEPVRHAWVVYREGDDEFLFDGVQGSAEAMIRPRTEVSTAYIPQVGADRRGRRFAFAGLFRSAWGQRIELAPLRGP